MKKQRLFGAMLLCSGLIYGQSSVACVSTETAEEDTNSPSIVITNDCGEAISWEICINVSGREFKSYPRGTTSPEGVSRYGLSLKDGESFTYVFNYALGNGSKVDKPSC